MQVFVLDGLIGVGKSTVLNSLRDLALPGVAIVDEPVDAWEKTGLLDGMYSGKMSKGQFQIMALSTRVLRMLHALRDPSVHTVIMERSPWSDRDVFAKLHLSDEWDIRSYNAIFQEVCNALADIQPHVLLLSAPVPVLMQRQAMRQRHSESSITEAYMHELEAAYQTYFDSLQVDKVKIDTCCPSAEVLDKVLHVVQESGTTCGGPSLRD